MKFTQMGFVYLMFSVLLVILGIWDLIMIKGLSQLIAKETMLLIMDYQLEHSDNLYPN